MIAALVRKEDPDVSPDDPRHGSRIGYNAGCHEACCLTPHTAYQKRSRLRRLREGSQYIPATRVQKRLGWWSQYGVTAHAVSVGAGLSNCTLTAIKGGRVERSTERAVLAVTWDDLPGSALVNARLTRYRLYSLMAGGRPLHELDELLPQHRLVGGKWREQDRVRLHFARAVQRVFIELALVPVEAGQTASKARRRGVMVPMAWDDPGLPAMPRGWQPRRADRDETIQQGSDAPDPAVVQKLLELDRHVHSRPVEKTEAMRQWIAAGKSAASLARAHGWKDGRYTPAREKEAA